MEWERRPQLTCKLRIQSNSFFITDTSFPDVLHRTIRLTTKQLFSLRLFRVAYVSSWASYAPSIRHLYIHGLTPSNDLLSHMEQKERKKMCTILLNQLHMILYSIGPRFHVDVYVETHRTKSRRFRPSKPIDKLRHSRQTTRWINTFL